MLCFIKIRLTMLSKKLFSSYIQLRKLSNGVGVLGVPFNKGQPQLGTDLAPKVLRESGLIKELAEHCNYILFQLSLIV